MDPRAHLQDRRLYREFYSYESHPGVIQQMRPDEPRLLWALEHLQPDDDVVDIGCHKGEMTVWLRTRTQGEVVGIDLSGGAIAEASRYARALCAAPVRFLVALAELLPLASRSFDVAVLSEILEHVASPLPVLLEAERVVRDGGSIVISTPCDAERMDADGERNTLAAESGFPFYRHVREFIPSETLADRNGLECEEQSISDIRFRLAAYTVRHSRSASDSER